VGLGSPEQVGTASLKIVSNDGGSSIHADAGIIREENIQVITLDSLKIQDIGFIKMDVEENEYFVLLGATETLKESNNPPILFESNNKDPTLFNYISLLGYNIIRLNGTNNMFLATTD